MKYVYYKILILLIKINLVLSDPLTNPLECHPEEQTKVINILVNMSKEISRGLLSIASSKGSPILENTVKARSGEISEFEVAQEYMRSITDSMNVDLYPYKVQLNIVMTRDSVGELSGDNSFDDSCEVLDPVKIKLNIIISKESTHIQMQLE